MLNNITVINARSIESLKSILLVVNDIVIQESQSNLEDDILKETANSLSVSTGVSVRNVDVLEDEITSFIKENKNAYFNESGPFQVNDILEFVLGKKLIDSCKEQRNYFGYLETSNHCLNCDSENIEGGGFYVDGDTATQSIKCNECESEWDDVYELNGVSGVEIKQ
ncbi:hypothetical protein A3715_10250 [Oleiphilus sp. HI0009]|nr:hypothetical protein A3715_10250 [Oleiphilus sp. HI0009]